MTKLNQVNKKRIEKICTDYTEDVHDRQTTINMLTEEGLDQSEIEGMLEVCDKTRSNTKLYTWRREDYTEEFEVLDKVRGTFLVNILLVAQNIANRLVRDKLDDDIITNSVLHALSLAAIAIIEETAEEKTHKENLLSVSVGNLLLEFFKEDTAAMRKFCEDCIKLAESGHATRH